MNLMIIPSRLSLFFGEKIAKNVIPIQISGEKSPFSQKSVANISPSSNPFGESVTTCLSIGYRLNGSVQNCRQFCRNLPSEACHCFYATKLKKKRSTDP
jgi:hypothetical protein